MSDPILAALATFGKLKNTTRTSTQVLVDSSDRIGVLKEIAEKLGGVYNPKASGSSIGATILSTGFKVIVKADSNSGGVNKTAIQEVSVILCLDILVTHGVIDKELISSYSNSGRLDINITIESVKEFLLNDKGWLESSIASAKLIFTKFEKYKLKEYTFHRDSKVFNNIKTIGKTLSGINPDKWNPADVFLIHKSVGVISKASFNHIMEFNRYISEDNKTSKPIIGISLKKSEKEALHGSTSVNTILKLLNKPIISNSNSNFIKDRKLTDLGKKKFKTILGKLKANPFIYVHGDVTSVKEQLDKLIAESLNYSVSIFTALDFLDAINTTNQQFKDALKTGILLAMSITAVSCSHYKVSGSKVEIVKTAAHDDYFKSIDIKRIRIKLNGDMDTIIDYSIDGVNKKIQIRSKGSIPQFNVIATNEHNVKATKLSSSLLK